MYALPFYFRFAAGAEFPKNFFRPAHAAMRIRFPNAIVTAEAALSFLSEVPRALRWYDDEAQLSAEVPHYRGLLEVAMQTHRRARANLPARTAVNEAEDALLASCEAASVMAAGNHRRAAEHPHDKVTQVSAPKASIEQESSALTLSDASTGAERPVLPSVVQLLVAGELLETAQYLERSGLTREALQKAVGQQELFDVKLFGTSLFPTFFTDPRYRPEDLAEVTQLLAELPSERKLEFFLAPTAAHLQTPLEALAAGELEQVRAAAMVFAQSP